MLDAVSGGVQSLATVSETASLRPTVSTVTGDGSGKLLSPISITLMEGKYALYGFLMASALFGWFVADYEASLTSKYHPLMLLLIDAVVTLVVLGAALPLYFRGDMRGVLRQMSSITWREALSFIGLGLAGVVTGVLSISLLARHGVAYYKTSDNMIDILAGIVGVIMFTRKGLTWQQKLGVGMMGVGAYLFI